MPAEGHSALERVIGGDLPANAVNPALLNVLFDDETAAELESITGGDGYVGAVVNC